MLGLSGTKTPTGSPSAGTAERAAGTVPGHRGGTGGGCGQEIDKVPLVRWLIAIGGGVPGRRRGRLPRGRGFWGGGHAAGAVRLRLCRCGVPPFLQQEASCYLGCPWGFSGV